MVIVRQVLLYQLYNSWNRGLCILIFYKEEIRVLPIADIWHLSLIDAMGVHNDTAGLCLSEYPRKPNNRKRSRIYDVSQHISRTHTWQLIYISHHDKAHSRRDCLQK